MAAIEPSDYAQTLDALKRRVREARFAAQRKANTELIRLYWHIGHTILQRQKVEPWGSGVLAKLADDLRAQFP